MPINENRRQILEMLSQGKINAEEAERLIAALEKGRAPSTATTESSKSKPKYLRILVEANDENNPSPTKVNIRVPMTLLRAGVKLASLVPAQARTHINEAMKEHGMQINLNQLKPEHLEELIEQLNDLTVDVDESRTKVRIFCE